MPGAPVTNDLLGRVLRAVALEDEGSPSVGRVLDPPSPLALRAAHLVRDAFRTAPPAEGQIARLLLRREAEGLDARRGESERRWRHRLPAADRVLERRQQREQASWIADQIYGAPEDETDSGLRHLDDLLEAGLDAVEDKRPKVDAFVASWANLSATLHLLAVSDSEEAKATRTSKRAAALASVALALLVQQRDLRTFREICGPCVPELTRSLGDLAVAVAEERLVGRAEGDLVASTLLSELAPAEQCSLSWEPTGANRVRFTIDGVEELIDGKAAEWLLRALETPPNHRSWSRLVPRGEAHLFDDRGAAAARRAVQRAIEAHPKLRGHVHATARDGIWFDPEPTRIER